jgi:hypothetical protein
MPMMWLPENDVEINEMIFQQPDPDPVCEITRQIREAPYVDFSGATYGI